MKPHSQPTVQDCFVLSIKASCKICGIEFVGDAEKSVTWMLNHYNEHCNDRSIEMHPKYKNLLADPPNQLKMFEEQNG